jgi:Lrp/AsnC family leucine-responsive transcriptional regulator
MDLDKTDKKILNYLQKDAKMTTKELAMHLDLSGTAVYERVKKLEKAGVIESYVAVVNRAKVDKGFMVYCQIKLLQHKHEFVNKFEKEVIQFDEVLECYNISGNYDYILKVIVKNMKEYRDFLNHKLTSLDHISSAHSNFIINEVKNTSVLEV